MQFIFFIAAFNALFFAVLVFQKKKALHDRILICWLLYLGIYIGSYALLSDILFTGFHLLSAGFISLLLLQGPFLYLYISALIKEKFYLSGKHLLHFIPFLLFNAFLLISSFFPEISQGIRLDHQQGDYHPPLLFHFFLIITALSGPVYFVFSIRLFKKLDINIFNNFSFSEEINLDWLRKLVYSFGVVWTVLMAFATIHHVFQFITNPIKFNYYENKRNEHRTRESKEIFIFTIQFAANRRYVIVCIADDIRPAQSFRPLRFV